MDLTEPRREKLRELTARLRRRIVGQETAVTIVAERLLHGELGLTRPGRPKASFLFLGPTGVGKTELTQQFTEAIYGPGRLVRLDMSEYQTPDRVPLIISRITRGYDACGGAGTLLFDEIEKAHPQILDLLLQLLDAARLTAEDNRVLDFSSWYVVQTSNIGAQRIMAMRRSKYETMERLVRQDAQRELRPEIFARVTAVAVFDKLSYETQCRIAADMVHDEVQALRQTGCAIESEAGVVEVVIKRGYHDRLGARPMRDATEVLIRNALTDDLLQGGSGVGRLRPDVSGNRLQLRTPQPLSP